MKQFKVDSKKKVWHIEKGKFLDSWYGKKFYTTEKGYVIKEPEFMTHSYCGVSNWHEECDGNGEFIISKRSDLQERAFGQDNICPSCIRDAYADGKLLITPIEEAEDE